MQVRKSILLITVAVLVNCQLSLVNHAKAQTTYTSEYRNARLLYQEGKYNLSMEAFKKLIPYDKENPYSQYASFYYALSAYKLKYYSVSKDMLQQIKNLYPTWDKMEEVNYWIALNLFETGDIFQGVKLFNSLQDKKLQNDALSAEQYYISKVTDPETLRMLLEEHPADKVIGKALANLLVKNAASAEERAELETLITRFNLPREEYASTALVSIHKAAYSVAVLFPFAIPTLEPTPAKKKNQAVLDTYLGIALAADTLKQMGININIRSYDTERNNDKLKSILSKDEMKTMDMLISIHKDDNPLIQEFSKNYQINTITPLSNDSESVKDNAFGFLFQPNYETLGSKSAQYLATDPVASKKKCLVFYGSNLRDSVLAWNFIRKAESLGIKIILKQEVFREESNKIVEVLATPTELDEFKAAVQFTIPKDSIGAIFVASDDLVIYSKVISAVETRKDKTLIIGSENWMENNSVDLAKFQRMNFVLYSPNYVSSFSPSYHAFVNQFIRKHGRTPSSLTSQYARVGYELMWIIGTSLYKYGTYIQEGWNKEVQSGNLLQSFDFRFTNYNQLVPFVKFNNGTLEVIARY